MNNALFVKKVGATRVSYNTCANGALESGDRAI